MNKAFTTFKVILICATATYAHPTGDMIAVEDHVLWSYVSPIEDPDHHACVMIWNEGSNPKVLLKSEFQASDYMLYNRNSIIYIIERRYIQSGDYFQSRVLKMKLGEKPAEIWKWFKDEWHVGEGGFFMPSDDEIVFARYPLIYSMKKEKTPDIFQLDTPYPILGLRALENDNLLLLSENSCHLFSPSGKILKTWDNLLNKEVKNAPLNRNQVFDMDYQDGELLLAYWGNRSFDIISPDGERESLIVQDQPYVPHWVTYFKDKKLLFSSGLTFDGSNPEPKLIMYNSNQEIGEIWE